MDIVHWTMSNKGVKLKSEAHMPMELRFVGLHVYAAKKIIGRSRFAWR